MTNEDVQEALDIIGRLLDALLLTAPGQRGRPGSDLRRACGDLRALAEDYLRAGALGAPMLRCFEAARLAGATLEKFAGVRTGVVAEDPEGAIGIAIKQAAMRMCLEQQSQILVELRFRSREDVDRVNREMNAAFAESEEIAADALDTESYRTLIQMHAASTRHLVETARPLPRMVSFAFPVSMPALTLAHRIYADASRADELSEENKTINPLFPASSGRALAA